MHLWTQPHYLGCHILCTLPPVLLQGAPGSLMGSSLFLPDGAVGVFNLPSSWAVAQSHQSSSISAIDSETWIVMELMDAGTLAAAVGLGAFYAPGTGIDAVSGVWHQHASDAHLHTRLPLWHLLPLRQT